ncbi:MAG: hypothetical protein ABI999_06990 [Acidobacteriota bacterium]
MTELDEVWRQMLTNAITSARADGRHDVADYLSLKAANDTIRAAGVKWLFDSILEIAGSANRDGTGVTIERTEPYNFAYRGANLVGSQIRLVQGVRCLTIDAGWTRTPADGFMRGGALAVARLRHFGLAKANVELALLRGTDAPVWSDPSVDETASISTGHLKRHFLIFLGE